MPSTIVGLIYGAVGGFIASIVMAIIMNAMGKRIKISPPAILAKKMFGDASKKPKVLMPTMTLWGLIWAIFIVSGVFAATYVNGLLFALVPWLVLNLIMLPWAGAGVFGAKKWNMMWITSLVMHAIWGLVVVGVFQFLTAIIG